MGFSYIGRMHMLELVVFDVDGLMLDTESVWKEAFDKAGNKYGIQNMGSTLFPQLIGKSGRDEKEVLDRYLSQDIQELVIKEWERIGFGMLIKVWSASAKVRLINQ